MLQLDNKNLDAGVQQVLDNLQATVNAEVAFPEKRQRAIKLWKSKGGINGKTAFVTIAQELQEMCVYVNVCNYCEQNEANDIEHVWPKSFFPERTFQWSNYILACKQCNSAYKLDKCFVVDTAGNVHEVPRGTQPAFSQLAMINPRTEDPNMYLWLNMQTRQFELMDNLSTADYNKAEQTLYILQLNNRDLLLEDRKNSAIYYYQRMDLLVKILAARSHGEIETLLSPYDDALDFSKSLLEIQEEIKLSFKEHLSRFKHPSVWYAIRLVESKTDLKWKAIFAALPEALTW